MHGRRRASFAGKVTRTVFVAILVSGLSAQVSEIKRRAGLPEDWTRHHLKFNSAALRRHPEVASHEPRAAFQLYREARAAFEHEHFWRRHGAPAVSAPHRDWSEAMANGRIQFGQFPAKWTSDPFTPLTPDSCTTDYVVFGLNVAGSATQANLVAFNNLYSGSDPALCPGLQPNFLFSYNISTVPGGRITTSPVISLDGTKIAFVETDTTAGARHAILHVLTVPAPRRRQWHGSQCTSCADRDDLPEPVHPNLDHFRHAVVAVGGLCHRHVVRRHG